MTAAVAKALGGDVIGPCRIVAPGPGHSRADRSMSVMLDSDAADGFRVNSFADDDWRICRDHVRDMLGIPGSGHHRLNAQLSRPSPATNPLCDRSRIDIAHRLWREAVPIDGTLAAVYLLDRGLGLAHEVLDGHALRFLGACPFRLQDGTTVRLPSMLTGMVDIRTNELCGVHRTALKPDGRGKAEVPGLGNPKKMLGRAAGACVKLSADENVSIGLHVTEGIETALACMAMGFRPMWAALSAGGIAKFPVLAGIEALTVFTDHDATGICVNHGCPTVPRPRAWDSGTAVRCHEPTLHSRHSRHVQDLPIPPNKGLRWVVECFVDRNGHPSAQGTKRLIWGRKENGSFSLPIAKSGHCGPHEHRPR